MLQILHQYSMGYLEIFLAFFSLFLFCYCFRNKNGLPTNWPLVGMLPALLINHRRIHDCHLEVHEKFSLTTFLFKGPSFTNMDILITGDPLNVRHVMCTNVGNYHKGLKFREKLDILGDGIFSTDFEIWQYHRKMAQSFITHPQFHRFLVSKIWEKIETGLIPILDHVSKHGLEIGIQDLFGRFAFDTISNVIMNHDPKTLCIDLPKIPCSKALRDAEEAALYRLVLPAFVWKFQRWLGVGQEKKNREAWKTIDDFIYECISKKKEERSKISRSKASKVNEVGTDLISLYMDDVKESTLIGANVDKFLRDTFLAYLVAGLETTSVALSWFFYIVSKNPHVLSKIKEELDATMAQIEDYHDNNEIEWNWCDYLPRNFDQVADKLIYLHAAIHESLRLYPPVAFQGKVPLEPDILPSGHKVDSSMLILFNIYAMGRVKSIWGEDCCEFKPDRWISKTGKFRYEPSYKFFAFNSGPRTCLGKNMALTQMKAIIIAIISKYHLQPVEGHPIVPDVSFILHMRHGFKVKFFPISNASQRGGAGSAIIRGYA